MAYPDPVRSLLADINLVSAACKSGNDFGMLRFAFNSMGNIEFPKICAFNTSLKRRIPFFFISSGEIMPKSRFSFEIIQ
jgi:hypothetical protein